MKPRGTRLLSAALQRSTTRRGQWWVTWALLFGTCALWTISGPIFSGPDEPSHVIKSAAVVRGQLMGTDRQFGSTQDGTSHIATVFRGPAIFRESHQVPDCYKFKPTIPASCAAAFVGSTKDADLPTFAGHYQPIYYAIVGAPSLLLPSVKGIYLMRLLGGAACAALLASALASATSSRRSAALVLGTALALTPMVFYTASTVNPSALEISAALCLWVSALVLVADLDGIGGGRLVARIAASGALLALSRGLSPLWLAVIAVVILVAARPGTIARLVRRPDVRYCALALMVTTGLAVTWLLSAGTLETREAPRVATSVTSSVRASLGGTDTDLREMVGAFGWLDVEVPALTHYVWFTGVGAAVVGAFVVGRRRYVVALALLLLAIVVLPVALATVQASDLGPSFWQGRYTLPLAVGVPPLAVLAIADRVRVPTAYLSRLAAILLGAVALGHVLAYAGAIRRFTVGTSGPIMYVLSSDAWQPPLPAWFLLAGFAAVVVLLCWRLYRSIVRPTADDDEPIAPPGHLPPRIEPAASH